MKLTKHKADGDTAMDMTPMIDVVFQLIIFFVLITDLSQKELEDLKLPMAQKAVEDKPNPDDKRAIVNIRQDGTIVVKREVIYDPEQDDYAPLERFLSQMAQQMDQQPLPEDPGGKKFPDDPVLIRADEYTPFKMIQKIMEVCGKQGIQIWKIELAASIPNPNDAKTP
jgi:biopolymer transport protein ExbD